jgi:NADH-ubiquinone oxidoreductase chain 1
MLPFMLSPALGICLALILWVLYPHPYQSYYLKWGLVIFLCVSRLNVYTLFLSGWTSNSQYSLLGAIRGVAQRVSYEISIALILLSVFILLKSLDIYVSNNFTYHFILLLISPVLVIWFITSLAETNRTPFDLSEGESELVSGFNVEYNRGLFALIFMAEYINILFISLLTSAIFLCRGYSIILLATTIITAATFVWARASYPRIRYDHLIQLTWKAILPLTLSISSLLVVVV